MGKAKLRTIVALAVAVAVTACSGSGGGGGEAGVDGGTVEGGSCQEGFALDATVGACAEIVAAGDCPAGTMPEIGQPECRPVGWTSECPAGFVRPPSGWGCVDRFTAPAPACTGATREDLTSGTCVAIGDCNAAFPPATATLFVDDDGVEDATHFRTLAQATREAKKGDTIAVEAGTYAEVIELGTDDLSVVGRCPEKVVFKGPFNDRAGVFVPGATGTKLRGVTVTGFVGGILVEDGELTVEDTLVDANDTLGIYLRFGATATVRRSKIARTTRGSGAVGSAAIVYDAGVLTFEDSALADNYFHHAVVDGEGSTLIAKRTVFARNTRLSGEEAAISVVKGGLAKLSQSAILDSLTTGVSVEGAGSRAELEESVIRRTKGTIAESGGVGVFTATGGVAKLVSSAVTDHPVLGVYGGKDGGTVILAKSVILGTPPGGDVEFGRGASAAEKGRLEITDTAVIGCPQSGVGLQATASGTFDHLYVKDSRPIKQRVDNKIIDHGGFGLLVEDSSTATVTRSSFDGNTLAGVTSSLGSTVTVEAVLVRGTKEIPDLTAGTAFQVAANGTMTVTRSALVGNSLESVLVASGGFFSMTASTVHGTRATADGRFGHGIAVFTGARAELTDTAVYDSAAVGLISDGGQALVRGGTFARNQIALHAQNGASISQSDAAGDLASGEVRISASTRFIDNATRIGNGVLAVPGSPLE